MTRDDLLPALLAGDPGPALRASQSHLSMAGPRPASTVACFEPRMRDQYGHFAVLAGAYRDLFARQGRAMDVFHHAQGQNIIPEPASGLFSVMDHAVGAERPVDRLALEAFTRYFRDTIGLAITASNARFALFPTARYLTLPAIADALDSTQRLTGTIIGVMETWPVPDCENEALVSDAFRRTARSLHGSGKPFLVIAESGAIGEWLVGHGFSPDQVMVAPFPAAARFEAPERSRPAPARPHFSALGATRPVHNPEVMAAYLLSDASSDADWTVRMNVDEVATTLGLSVASLRRTFTDRAIQLLPLQQDQTAYDHALAAADVMLLPYGERYQTISSGIFLECLCAGVIPLVPAGTTMRRLYEHLGGMAPAIEAVTSEGIAIAVDLAARDILKLRENATTVRTAWLDHPHGPRAWAQQVGDVLAQAMG